MVSTAATSLTDVPAPLNRRIGGTVFDAGGAQAVVASELTNTSRATAFIAVRVIAGDQTIANGTRKW
jgi:hypothetical protein